MIDKLKYVTHGLKKDNKTKIEIGPNTLKSLIDTYDLGLHRFRMLVNKGIPQYINPLTLKFLTLYKMMRNDDNNLLTFFNSLNEKVVLDFT